MSSKYVGIEDARKSLGPLVTAVQQGVDVVLTRNGKPAARIVRYQEDPVTILKTTLTEHDAWGKPRTVEIEWMPQDVTALVEPSRLNVRNGAGMRIVAHDTVEDPPVYLQPHHTNGSVVMTRWVREHTGEFKHVTEFSRVETREDLEPGTFFIASDSDA